MTDIIPLDKKLEKRRLDMKNYVDRFGEGINRDIDKREKITFLTVYRPIEKDIKLTLQNIMKRIEDLIDSGSSSQWDSACEYCMNIIRDECGTAFTDTSNSQQIVSERVGNSNTMGTNANRPVDSQQENLEDNGNTMCDTTSAKRKSDYIAMSENTQKQNVDKSQEQETKPLSVVDNKTLGSNSNDKILGCDKFVKEELKWDTNEGYSCGQTYSFGLFLCNDCQKLQGDKK